MAPSFFVSASARPHLTTLSTRRARTAIYHIFPVRFNNGKKPFTRHKIKNANKQRRGVMQIKKLKVRPQKSTRSPLACLLLNFDFVRPSLSTLAYIHYICFHCRRSTGGALWAPTRINARMLGSHERRQIYRALPRSCPGSL